MKCAVVTWQELKQKVMAQRRKDVTKELRFSSQSAEHDVNNKLAQGLSFLEKVSLPFSAVLAGSIR